MLTSVMEDYLRTIHELHETDREYVPPSELASQLSVKPPTVTNMTKKLDERGLVVREAHQGVRLTDEGRSVAIEVIRHHRLLETYLVERLGYDWADVHEEADVLEHHISETLEQRIAESLDDTRSDPHGSPIPSESLGLATYPDMYLDECEVGANFIVLEVSDRDPDQLIFLEETSILPGVELSVTEAPPAGPVTVQPKASDTAISLPRDVAESIRVRELAEETEQAVTSAYGGK